MSGPAQITEPRAAAGFGTVGVTAFVRALLERFEALHGPTDGRHEIPDDILMQLRLAEAALRFFPEADAAARQSAQQTTRDLYQNQRLAARPAQVAVLGPTQVGKSTIVNLLLGRAVAGVSPLAGYTVHAQGFAARVLSNDADWVATLFPGSSRVAQGQLTPEALATYSLTDVALPAGTALPPCIVWDSPDFDSLMSRNYRDAVLELSGLADVFVLVLSKEKYSDLSAWRMLKLLAPLQRPLVVVLNKLTPDAADAVTVSFRERQREQIAEWRDVELVAVPFHAGLTGAAETELPDAAAGLRSALGAALERADRAHATAGVRTYLRRGWAAWTAPLRNEHAAFAAWQGLVETGLARLLDEYRREYIDHPQRFDSFRRATVELLQLLELPGVGSALTKVRWVVTAPARLLFSAGRSWWGTRGRGARRSPPGDEEILRDVVGNLLAGLRMELARRAAAPGAAVWRALGARLEAEEPRLRRTMGEAVRTHQHRVAQEIHAAANKLYAVLREKPALLNTLRGARATADAASILLAIKTGGLHVNDLLVAPAMFGLMSLMTEGAVGTYMSSIADDLKAKQFEHVRATLIEAALAPALRALADELSGPGLIGVAPEELAAVETALNTWERDPHG